MIGNASEVAETAQRREVLDLLRAGPATAKAIAKALRVEYEATRKRLQRLEADGFAYYRSYTKDWAITDRQAI